MDFSKFKDYEDIKEQLGLTDGEIFELLRRELVIRGVLKSI